MSINAKYVKIEDEISANGACIINTTGTSMRPLLKTNDAVTVKAPDRKIKKYDVVLYRDFNLNKYVLHRVIGIRSDVFVIRGDNTYRKEYVPSEEIIGYMVSYIRKGKVKSVKNIGYRLYSRLWHISYPLRVLRIKIKSFVKKITKKGSR